MAHARFLHTMSLTFAIATSIAAISAVMAPVVAPRSSITLDTLGLSADVLLFYAFLSFGFLALATQFMSHFLSKPNE